MLSVQRGRQEWKFGIDIAIDKITYLNAQNFTGSYQFQSLESFGRNLAGNPNPQSGELFRQTFSGVGTAGTITHPDMQQYAVYAEDAFRMRQNLTLHLGLRYDLQETASPPVKNLSPSLTAAGIDTSLIRNDHNNLAPRIGLAWSPRNDSCYVVRLGYGIFYAPTPAVLTVRAHYQNGISVQLRTFSADNPITRALIPVYPNSVCGLPDPGGSPPNCAPPAQGGSPPVLMVFSPIFRQPYIQQGSLGIEGEVKKGVAISATYLMFKGTHLQRIRDVNLGTPTAVTSIGIAGSTVMLAFRKFILPRPMPDFDGVLQVEGAANSIYHGLAMQVRKSYSRGMQIMGSYTFSKTIDDNPNVYAINPGLTDSWLVADSSNPGADRAVGDNNQPHRLALSGVMDAPRFDSFPPPLHHLMSDWQLSWIVTAQSGLPYSGMVSYGYDINNDGNAASDRTPGIGRNTFHMPATVSFNPRVTRAFTFAKGVRVMIAWEAFNVMNRGNIHDVDRTQNAYEHSQSVCGIAGTPCLRPLPSFGSPTVAAGPRIMQLSVRMVF